MRMCMRFVCVPLAIMPVVLAACLHDSSTNVPSDEVPTSQIFATFQVIEEGGQEVYVEAQLTRDMAPNQPDGDTFVRVSGSDQLWLSGGEHFSQLEIEGDLFQALRSLGGTQIQFRTAQEIVYLFLGLTINMDGDRYFARLPEHEDGHYQVAFLREGYTSALESSVMVPEDFTITRPLAGDNFSRADDAIRIDWTPVESDVVVRIEVKSSCLDGESDVYREFLDQDPGTHELAPGVLSSESLNGYCTSSINVIRSRLGSFDPVFAGGRVAGHQIRGVSVTTTD